MARTIVNLTTAFVQSEANQILAANSLESYQPLFATSPTRDRLISYVMSRLPGLYAVVDEEDSVSIQCDSFYCSTELQIQIQQLIQQGIQHILNESIIVKQPIPLPEDEAAYAPSHWFG